MNRREAFEIFLCLLLAFASEGLALVLLLDNGRLAMPMLCQLGFFGGLILAFHIARNAQRRVLDRPRGTFCSQCNYDMRATPDRCPECGGISTGRHVGPPPPGTAAAQITLRILGLAFVAFIAAVIIMMHTLAALVTAGGGGGH